MIHISEKHPLSEVAPQNVSKSIAVFQLDSPVFFGAVKRFVKILKDTRDIKVLILKMQNLPSIDFSEIIVLEELDSDLKQRGCRLMLSELQPAVLMMLEQTGLLKKIGEENCTTRCLSNYY
jgi:SulP family sulfate permease